MNVCMYIGVCESVVSAAHVSAAAGEEVEEDINTSDHSSSPLSM